MNTFISHCIHGERRANRKIVSTVKPARFILRIVPRVLRFTRQLSSLAECFSSIFNSFSRIHRDDAVVSRAADDGEERRRRIRTITRPTKVGFLSTRRRPRERSDFRQANPLHAAAVTLSSLGKLVSTLRSN